MFRDDQTDGTVERVLVRKLRTSRTSSAAGNGVEGGFNGNKARVGYFAVFFQGPYIQYPWLT